MHASARAVESEERGRPRSKCGEAGPLCDCPMAASVSFFLSRCYGMPVVADFPTLSLGSKETNAPYLE